MIPYLLAVAGGYLIGNSLKSEKFTNGGMTETHGGMMAKGGNVWSEIRSGFEDEGVTYIDGYLTDDDDEEGKVIAKVKEDGEVEYVDNRAKKDLYAQEIIKEVVKAKKMADGGMMAKGGKTKKKGDVGKSGTQYGYTLKEYEEMGEKMGLFVSPKNWWKSQEGKKYEDSFGRTQTIGRHSGDEEQEMMRYGYRIAIGMDLGSDKIPASARKYVIDNNLEK